MLILNCVSIAAEELDSAIDIQRAVERSIYYYDFAEYAKTASTSGDFIWWQFESQSKKTMYIAERRGFLTVRSLQVGHNVASGSEQCRYEFWRNRLEESKRHSLAAPIAIAALKD